MNIKSIFYTKFIIPIYMPNIVWTFVSYVTSSFQSSIFPSITSIWIKQSKNLPYTLPTIISLSQYVTTLHIKYLGIKTLCFSLNNSHMDLYPLNLYWGRSVLLSRLFINQLKKLSDTLICCRHSLKCFTRQT